MKKILHGQQRQIFTRTARIYLKEPRILFLQSTKLSNVFTSLSSSLTYWYFRDSRGKYCVNNKLEANIPNNRRMQIRGKYSWQQKDAVETKSRAFQYTSEDVAYIIFLSSFLIRVIKPWNKNNTH